MALSLTDKLLAPLTFNKDNLTEIGNDSSNTTLALIIILVNSALAGVVSLVTGAGGLGLDQVLGDDSINDVGLFLVSFLFGLLILLFFSWVLKSMLGLFGGKATTGEALRMIAFASLWDIVGTLLSLIPGVAGFAIIFTILFLVALAIGVSGSAGISLVSAIIAIILAYIVAVLLIVIIFLILFLLFLGALFAAV